MNRRDFLLLRPGGNRQSMVLSCERLYMRYVDAELDGSSAELFANLDREMRRVDTLELTDTVWLTREDVKERLDTVLDAFRARGGQLKVKGKS